jgi:hypothetical protein
LTALIATRLVADAIVRVVLSRAEPSGAAEDLAGDEHRRDAADPAVLDRDALERLVDLRRVEPFDAGLDLQVLAREVDDVICRHVVAGGPQDPGDDRVGPGL